MIFWVFIFGLSLSALEAEVQVLTTPMFQTPDTNSKIVQYLRKGEKIYVHNPGPTSDLKIVDEYDMDIEIEEKAYVPGDFYLSLDKLGKEAYVLKKHVRVIYNDIQDLDEQEIIEDTDYRRPWPISDKYPLADNYSSQTVSYFSIMNSYKFNYFDLVMEETTGPVLGFSVRHLKYKEKVYVGIHYGIFGSMVKVEFPHYQASSLFGGIFMGPMISYPLININKGLWIISLSFPIKLLGNFMSLNSIKQQFTGISYDIKMGLDYNYKFTEGRRMTMGLEMGYSPQFILNSKDPYYLWQGKTYLEGKSTITLAATVGITHLY